MTEFDFSSLTPVQRSALLTRLVAPRPIAFVSTLDAGGIGNLAPFSNFNHGGGNPPSVVFCTHTDRNGKHKHTLDNILATREYVISIVSAPMAAKMNIASFEYDEAVDEFDVTGFTRMASVKVAPPGVAESAARLECRLFETVRHGSGAAASTYIIGEVVYATVNDDVLTDGLPDNHKLHQLARLGADYYTSVAPESLFLMKRPTSP